MVCYYDIAMTEDEGERPNSDLETDSSTVSNEISELREDLTEIEEKWRKSSEITRVQRAHLIVAVGVVGAFATLYTLPEEPFQFDVFWTSQDPIYALLIYVILFLIYIPIHLYTITILMIQQTQN